MTSKIEAKRQGIGAPDGWCSPGDLRVYKNNKGTGLVLMHHEDITEHGDNIPIKIIPHDTWERLISWCRMMAQAHRRDLETLNCDDSLNEILEGIENGT